MSAATFLHEVVHAATLWHFESGSKTSRWWT
jgi:hypothetical protein